MSYLCLLVSLLALLTSACATATPAPQSPSWYDVDPVFRAFWDGLGGMAVVGPAISPAYTEDGRTVQYLETAKMVFDPQLVRGKRFYLAPLGALMGIYEPPVTASDQSGLLYLNGHTVHPIFRQLYEKLTPQQVGKPLTEMRHNPQRQRYEQYFENVGMYHLEGSTEVHLLAYGARVCGNICRPAGPENAIIDIGWPIDPLFQGFVEKFGVDFTGFALTPPYLGRDGNWEQVLENLVLQIDSSLDPNSVHPRPLAKDLMIAVEPPQPYSGDPNRYFLPVTGNNGYEIPLFFWDYISQHGGLELTGPPISHYAPQEETVYRQCYEKLCLVYDLQLPENARVRPESLGFAYRQLNYHPVAPMINPPTTDDLTVRIWERQMSVTSVQRQQIGISVLCANQPCPNIQAELILRLPDGVSSYYLMPPTDANGVSVIDLPPIQAPNGALIAYEVCVSDLRLRKTCYPESFVIWNNP